MGLQSQFISQFFHTWASFTGLNNNINNLSYTHNLDIMIRMQVRDTENIFEVSL